MTALQRIAAYLLLAVVAMAACGLYVHYTAASHYDAGYAAAVAAGTAERDRQADAYRNADAALRADLAARDADAFKKEQDHAKDLAAAQRRVRAGTDSLRCPGAVSAAAAPATGPAAAEPATDQPGPAIVPETAADILGIGADVAGLVRRYDRLVERFDACRALNAVP